MKWFNYYGLIFVVAILIPNIIYAVTHKENGFTYKNKIAEILEQIGRYACMILMIFNIPYTWIGFYFSFAETVYLIVNTIFVFVYCLLWIIFWKKSGIIKAILLSVIPSLLFLFSGIMIASIPLVIFAIVFAVTHILISVKSELLNVASVKTKKQSIITVTAMSLSVVFISLGIMGGITIYGQSNLSKLNSMSAMDMINYTCSDKNSKISIALIDNGNVTYHIYGKNGEEETIYDYEIGSISKTFVGLLCAKAVSEGKLNITDSIAKYLDLDETKYYPTIERLLTHTSGYKAYYFESRMIGNKFAQITNDFYGINRTQILDKVMNTSLENKDYPFVYSNFGISVIGLVLEKIYKDDFTNIMNEFISSELNLKNTRVAKQSGNLNKYWKWKINDGYIPAGSIISNIEDMASYLSIYLGDKIDYATTAYTKLQDINANNQTYEKMNIRMDSVGMTWMIDDKNDIVWHNGATTNFNSYIGFTKDKKRGVILLSNLSPNEKISMTVIGAKILTDKNLF